jgi:hypothetical protein
MSASCRYASNGIMPYSSPIKSCIPATRVNILPRTENFFIAFLSGEFTLIAGNTWRFLIYPTPQLKNFLRVRGLPFARQTQKNSRLCQTVLSLRGSMK